MVVKIYSFEISESTLHSSMFTRDNLILLGIMYICFSAKSNFHLGVLFTQKLYSYQVNNVIQMCNCSLFNMMERKYSFYKTVSFNFDYPVAILFLLTQYCKNVDLLYLLFVSFLGLFSIVNVKSFKIINNPIMPIANILT